MTQPVGRPKGRTKTKMSLSLDKDIASLLKESGNASTWVNELLRAKLASKLIHHQAKQQAEQDMFMEQQNTTENHYAQS